MSLQTLLSRLDRLRKTGKHSWRACCPGHNGSNPTALAITEADDGTVLLRCHVGCDASQIVGAIGMELSDLFPPKPEGHARKSERLPFNPRDVLAAAVNELMLGYLCCRDMAAGKPLTDTDRARLLVAAGRLKAAAEAARAS